MCINSCSYCLQGDQGFPGPPGRRGAPGIPVSVFEIGDCMNFYHLQPLSEGV